MTASVLVTHDAPEVAYLVNDTNLPARDVIEDEEGRHLVVGQVTAILVLQRLGDTNQRIDG